MALVIKQATLADRKPWAAMRFELWPDAGVDEHAADLAKWLKRRRFRAWIAREGGLPVGFAEAYVRDFANGCDGRPVAFLEGIWVKKAFRRQGIGKELVKRVEQWARAQGLKELGSDAYLRDRRSHRSHRAWGFSETERVVYFRKSFI